MYKIEATETIGDQEVTVWFRDLDRVWTHHETRVQYYQQTEAAHLLQAIRKHDKGHQNAVMVKVK